MKMELGQSVVDTTRLLFGGRYGQNGSWLGDYSWIILHLDASVPNAMFPFSALQKRVTVAHGDVRADTDLNRPHTPTMCVHSAPRSVFQRGSYSLCIDAFL